MWWWTGVCCWCDLMLNRCVSVVWCDGAMVCVDSVTQHQACGDWWWTSVCWWCDCEQMCWCCDVKMNKCVCWWCELVNRCVLVVWVGEQVCVCGIRWCEQVCVGSVKWRWTGVCWWCEVMVNRCVLIVLGDGEQVNVEGVRWTGVCWQCEVMVNRCVTDNCRDCWRAQQEEWFFDSRAEGEWAVWSQSGGYWSASAAPAQKSVFLDRRRWAAFSSSFSS